MQKILKNKDFLLIYDEKEKDIRIQIKSSIVKITFNDFGFKIFIDDVSVSKNYYKNSSYINSISFSNNENKLLFQSYY
jgi:hypothetical protein